MQKFEPDQLVLVRVSEHTNWDLAHYSYCVVKEGKATFHHLQGWTLLFRDDEIIPYSGNEHLLGTTNSPAPKWKPKPGELVAVSDTGEEDDWEIGIYKGRSKRKEMPYLVYRSLVREYMWKFCEPLRKHFNIPEE